MHACDSVLPSTVAPQTRTKPDVWVFFPALQCIIEDIQPGIRCGSIVCSYVMFWNWPFFWVLWRFINYIFWMIFLLCFVLSCEKSKIWTDYEFSTHIKSSVWQYIVGRNFRERSMFPAGCVTPVWKCGTYPILMGNTYLIRVITNYDCFHHGKYYYVLELYLGGRMEMFWNTHSLTFVWT